MVIFSIVIAYVLFIPYIKGYVESHAFPYAGHRGIQVTLKGIET